MILFHEDPIGDLIMTSLEDARTQTTRACNAAKRAGEHLYNAAKAETPKKDLNGGPRTPLADLYRAGGEATMHLERLTLAINAAMLEKE